MPKYGMFNKEPPHGKNEVQYDQWIFEVQELQKTYEEALVREAIIFSLKGKAWPALSTILGIMPLCQTCSDKLNADYGAM